MEPKLQIWIVLKIWKQSFDTKKEKKTKQNFENKMLNLIWNSNLEAKLWIPKRTFDSADEASIMETKFGL